MNYVIKLCLEEAKKAFKKGEVPVGCVIVKEGEVIAKAHNRVEELKDPTAHAEMLALREATRITGSKFLYDCEVYVSLEPCIMCAYAMVLSRVKKVVFLAKDERHGGVISLYNIFDDIRLNHKVVWEYLPVEESRELLRNFFKELRR